MNTICRVPTFSMANNYKEKNKEISYKEWAKTVEKMLMPHGDYPDDAPAGCKKISYNKLPERLRQVYNKLMRQEEASYIQNFYTGTIMNRRVYVFDFYDEIVNTTRYIYDANGKEIASDPWGF